MGVDQQPARQSAGIGQPDQADPVKAHRAVDLREPRILQRERRGGAEIAEMMTVIPSSEKTIAPLQNNSMRRVISRNPTPTGWVSPARSRRQRSMAR